MDWEEFVRLYNARRLRARVSVGVLLAAIFANYPGEPSLRRVLPWLPWFAAASLVIYALANCGARCPTCARYIGHLPYPLRHRRAALCEMEQDCSARIDLP